MNYLLYDEAMKILSRHNTKIEAVTAGRKWQSSWAMSGCQRPRHFTVHYNGTKSTEEFNSRDTGGLK